MTRLFLLGLAILFCVTSPARADEVRPGYMEFSQQTAQEWTLVWRAPLRTGLEMSVPVLPDGCEFRDEPQREISQVAVTTIFAVSCVQSIEGRRIGLPELAVSETDVLVRIAPESRPVQTVRLTSAQPEAEIKARPGVRDVAFTYLIIGTEHILTGYDHLLFVIALVLLLDNLWAVAKAATAFTLAHSITLVGSTLELMWLPQDPVESVIALSILFLAVEIAKKEPGKPRFSERLPWLVAFLFGLLHGYGFAGALKEVGLPEGEVPMALLTFNLGVELGQLAVIVSVVAILAGLRRWLSAFEVGVIRLATFAIGVTASFWLIERIVT